MPNARQQRVRANAQRTGRVGCQQLDRDVTLVVQHRHVEVVAALRQQHVGALRAVDAVAFGAQLRHRG